MVNDLNTVILLHDPNTGEVLDANPAAEDLYGYPPDELTQLSVEAFSSECDRYSQERAEELIEAAADGEEQEFEWQIQKKCGERRWVNVRLARVEVDGDEYVLAEENDITEEKARTRRLRLLYRVIRHNLRNDMTVILGNTASLCGEISDEQYQERLTMIRETAEELGAMTDSVEDIVQFAVNEESQATPTEILPLLDDIIDDIESSYPSATVEVCATDSAVVAADGGLRVALYNAIENAIEHSQQADPVASVEVETTPAEGTVTIQVVDNGPEIPQMEIDALDSQNDRTATNHGTGVGLFVMKWCTESLGGSLDISSAETGGNLVEFTFPMCQERPEAGEAATA